MAGCLAVVRASADPFVGFLYPAGVQAGKTVRVLVGGQGLDGVDRGWASGEGVRVVKVEHVPRTANVLGEGQREWLGKWLRNLEDGVKARPPLPKDEVLRSWSRNPWWETLDKLDPLSLSIVARNYYSPRPDPLQAAPAIAERLILTVTADATAKPGLRSLLLHSGSGAGAPHPFFVSVEPRVAEPLYEAPPRDGKRKLRAEPSASPTPVVLDGQIRPGETDVFRLALAGGTRLQCLLTGRELVPYLGDAVPGFFNPVLRLTDEEGHELAFADDFLFLPDPVLVCDIPKTGTYRLEVRDNLYRGRDDFVYAVSCFADGRPLPTPQERAFVCRPGPAAYGSREECVPCPGAKVSFDFEVEKPGTWVFDLFARRIGSPLDGVLRLYGPMTGWLWKDGPLLATWDDVTNKLYVGSVPQAECDPSGTWEFAEPGDYRLVVEDRVDGGGEAYGFVLDIAPCEPDFEIYALKSSLVFRPGRDVKARFTVKIVRRNGFEGAITVMGNDVLTVERGAVSAREEQAEIVVRLTHPERRGVTMTRLTAVAERGDRSLMTHPVVPGNEVEQAFAYTHVLPASDLFVIAREPPVASKEPPTWTDMPYDGFLPRRVIYPSVDVSAFKTDFVVGMDAAATTDVSIVKAPADAADAVLAAKFASSAAHARKRDRGVFAAEPKGAGGESAAARSVLAGCGGMVTANLDYAEGDERRVRIFARALGLPHDNDVLLYVPSAKGNPLSGSVGAAARRLRDGGFSFDFASDRTLAAALRSRNYRAVYVPKTRTPMAAVTRKLLDEAAKGQGQTVVSEGASAKEDAKRLAKAARAERFPKGLRFARFGRQWGEGWYFVHNPTAAKVSGEVNFKMRGKVRSAYGMDVRTGKVEPLPTGKKGGFVLSLESGGSAWIRVTH